MVYLIKKFFNWIKFLNLDLLIHLLMNDLSSNKTLRISSPCPMSLNSLKNNNGDNYCKSCSKNIVDYRGKSWEELLTIYQKGSCGIFDQKEIADGIQWIWYKKILFYGLSFLSILGISVKPVFSQSNKTTTTTDSVWIDTKPAPKECVNENQLNSNSTENPKAKPKNNKGIFRKKKKKKYRALGCPDF